MFAGERWYLRLILKNRAVASFEDCKVVRGVQHGTYQEAAISSGYVKDGEEALNAYKEAMILDAPAQLRALFVMMTLQGYPTLLIFCDDVLRGQMLDENGSKTRAQLEEMLLNDLQRRFAYEGKQPSSFGLPEPLEHMSELQAHRLKSVVMVIFGLSDTRRHLMVNSRMYSIQLLVQL